MTVELLHPARTAPAAPRAEEDVDGATPFRELLGARHGWGDAERDCPYCAGPETD